MPVDLIPEQDASFLIDYYYIDYYYIGTPPEFLKYIKEYLSDIMLETGINKRSALPEGRLRGIFKVVLTYHRNLQSRKV